VSGKGNEGEALKAWHRLMAEERKPKPEPRASTVKQVCEGYLTEAEARVSAGCLRNYRLFLSPFCKRHGSRRADTLTVAEAETFAK
jgi:hypothetical protein